MLRKYTYFQYAVWDVYMYTADVWVCDETNATRARVARRVVQFYANVCSEFFRSVRRGILISETKRGKKKSDHQPRRTIPA